MVEGSRMSPVSNCSVGLEDCAKSNCSKNTPKNTQCRVISSRLHFLSYRSFFWICFPFYFSLFSDLSIIRTRCTSIHHCFKDLRITAHQRNSSYFHTHVV